MSEHTPPPWQDCGKWVCEENDPGHNVGICVCENRATEAETLANAAFIVKAVNNHDALMLALEQCAAPFATPPGSVAQCQAEIGKEFQRRMDIAGNVLAAVQASEVSDDR